MHKFTIAVLLFYCAISFSYAETCPEDDPVIGCSFDEKDVCISGYDKSKVTGTSNLLTYKYSAVQQISLTCHATKFRRHTKFNVIWKKGDEAASIKTTCQSQTININLLTTPTRTNYTCMVVLPDYGESDSYLSVIEFVYCPPIITKDKQQNNSLKDPKERGDDNSFTPKQYILILFATICALAAISTIILYVVTRRKKVQKEDKQRLHSEVTSNSQGNISINNAQSTPQLCETYATPQTNTTSPTIYCDPYVPMYSQPIPKSLRNPNNTGNNCNTYINEGAINNLNNNTTGEYSNLKNAKDSDADMYSDPLMYDYVS